MSKIYNGLPCRIEFRCSDALHAAILLGAQASGMDVSTYIRAALWTAAPRVLRLTELVKGSEHEHE